MFLGVSKHDPAGRMCRNCDARPTHSEYRPIGITHGDFDRASGSIAAGVIHRNVATGQGMERGRRIGLDRADHICCASWPRGTGGTRTMHYGVTHTFFRSIGECGIGVNEHRHFKHTDHENHKKNNHEGKLQRGLPVLPIPEAKICWRTHEPIALIAACLAKVQLPLVWHGGSAPTTRLNGAVGINVLNVYVTSTRFRTKPTSGSGSD